MDNLTGSARGLGPGAEIDGVTGDGAALMSDEQPSVPRQRAESWITQSPHQPQKWGDAMAHRETDAEQADTEPRPAAVTFVTTEHFTLQRARSSTIAEARGRATMFLGAVSGSWLPSG